MVQSNGFESQLRVETHNNAASRGSRREKQRRNNIKLESKPFIRLRAAKCDGRFVGRICSHELSRILDPGLFRGPLVGRFHFNPSSSDLHVYARIVYKSCFACSGSLACICTVAHDQCQYGILVSNSIEVTVQCSVLF